MARHPPHRQRAILDFERNVSVVMAANLIVAARINPEWRDASSDDSHMGIAMQSDKRRAFPLHLLCCMRFR